MDMEAEIKELKDRVMWLAISCLCCAISLLIINHELTAIARRLTIFDINLGSHHLSIDGLYQRMEAEKVREAPIPKRVDD